MVRHLIFAILALLFAGSELTAQDWSQLRGNDGYGNADSTNGILKQTSAVRFQVKWKRKLGSGYSSVVVSGENVVTMFTDGKSDFVVCLDGNNGETKWKYETNPMFKGENGSFDGPLSTPVVTKDHVYALSAVGELYCLTLGKGEKVWSKNLKDFEVNQPLYGFVTSPMLVGETLVVQVGAKDKAVVGFEVATGEVKWSVGNDRINSQSPAVTSIDGRTVVLLAGGLNLMGVDPNDGTVLFEFKHDGGNGSAMVPVPIGDNNVLLTLDDAFSKAISLRQQDDNKIHVSEEWKDRSIKNTYNIPVEHDGHVYAYSTRILTCVDAKTGRAKWKDRKPGDGFVVIADGHLVITTKKGSLHLAKANDKSYDEIAQMELFEDLVWSVPAVSDSSIYVRSLGEIARVDIESSSAKTEVVANESMPIRGSFLKLVDAVNDLADDQQQVKQELVDAWLENQTQFPVIIDNVAHFIYQGDEQDVALAGDFFGARQEKPMKRLAGTNLRYFAKELPMDQRVNYCFLTNFTPITDKRNSRVMTSSMYAGEMEFAVRLPNAEPLKMSWFAMPDWDQPDYFSSNGSAKEKVIEHELVVKLETETEPSTDVPAEETKEQKINFEVILPPGYKDSNDEYPVCYLMDAKGAKENGNIETALANLFDANSKQPVAPAITVMATPAGPGFGKLLMSEVIPFIEKEYRVKSDRESRLIAGFGFFGTAASLIGANSNDSFGAIAVQSPLSFDAEQRMILEAMSKIDQPTKVHMQWGRFDMFNPHENWDVRTIGQHLMDGIQANEKIEASGGMVNDSCDWSSWRNRYREVYGLLK